jgi:putative transposase
VVADLVEARSRDDLRAASVRDAAECLGVGGHTVWRWIAAGGPPRRRRASSRRVELDDELRDAYVRLRGNVAAAWREQCQLGNRVAPLRTLQAAFARELRPAERASVKRGEAGRREHRLYLRYQAPHRNAVWQADHKQLPGMPAGRHGQRRPSIGRGLRSRCCEWIGDGGRQRRGGPRLTRLSEVREANHG